MVEGAVVSRFKVVGILVVVIILCVVFAVVSLTAVSEGAVISVTALVVAAASVVDGAVVLPTVVVSAASTDVVVSLSCLPLQALKEKTNVMARIRADTLTNDLFILITLVDKNMRCLNIYKI